MTRDRVTIVRTIYEVGHVCESFLFKYMVPRAEDFRRLRETDGSSDKESRATERRED